jgi:Flp pilus assembly protein TadD
MLAGKLIRGARPANSRPNAPSADYAARAPSPAATHEGADAHDGEHDSPSGQRRGMRDRFMALVDEMQSARQTIETLEALRVALTADPATRKHRAAPEASKAKADEEVSRTHLERAERYLFTGQVGAAAVEMAHAADRKPDDTELQMRAVRLLVRTGQAGRAVRLAKRAVALAPDCVDLRFDLARAFMAAGLRLAARREVRRLREMAPADTRLAHLEKEL